MNKCNYNIMVMKKSATRYVNVYMLWLTGLCNILLPTLSLVILNTIVVRTIEKHAQVVMIKLMVVLVMMFTQGY